MLGMVLSSSSGPEVTGRFLCSSGTTVQTTLPPPTAAAAATTGSVNPTAMPCNLTFTEALLLSCNVKCMTGGSS